MTEAPNIGDQMTCRACGRPERASEGYPCQRCGTFLCVVCNLQGVLLCKECQAKEAPAAGSPAASQPAPGSSAPA